MLVYFLYAIFILACAAMIISVLLQPGKADAQALFTSSFSSTAFGPRGTQTLLAKITIGAAAVFMLSALLLSLPAVTGQRSVLQSTAPEATPTPASTPAATPQTGTAPAASPGEAATPANVPDAGADAGGNATNNANAQASPQERK